jgi:hypothetical protein
MVVLPAPLCTISPVANRRVRGPTKERCTARAKNHAARCVIKLEAASSLLFNSECRHLLSFQRAATGSFPHDFLLGSHLGTSNATSSNRRRSFKLSQPATRRAILNHFEIFKHSPTLAVHGLLRPENSSPSLIVA